MQVCFPCVRSVIEIARQSTNKKTGATTNGRRLYLSSQAKQPPRSVLNQIRQRWNVENKNHHPRDATFLEDKCRCRTKNTAANLALLRGAVLCLWKRTQPSTPATRFVQRNRMKLDEIIGLIDQNQRLTKMK
jgi:predicted transposase YbfD/YdcC